jgi:hypothetical protein
MHTINPIMRVVLIVMAFSLSSMVDAETAAKKPADPINPSSEQNAKGTMMGCRHGEMKGENKCPHTGMVDGHMKRMSGHMQKMHPQPISPSGAKESTPPKASQPAPAKKEN